MAAELRVSSASHPITLQNISRRVIYRSSRPGDCPGELPAQHPRPTFWHPHVARRHRLLLRNVPDPTHGILDLVIQQQTPLTYQRSWVWDSVVDLRGHVEETATGAAIGDVEIWDYKGTRANSPFVDDYVRQLLTYAALYRDRTGTLPVRCVLFFINEPRRDRLLAIEVTAPIVDAALGWTYEQVRLLRATADTFEGDPVAVPAGELARDTEPLGQRLSQETTKQCTACTFRFDCPEYTTHLAGGRSIRTSTSPTSSRTDGPRTCPSGVSPHPLPALTEPAWVIVVALASGLPANVVRFGRSRAARQLTAIPSQGR